MSSGVSPRQDRMLLSFYLLELIKDHLFISADAFFMCVGIVCFLLIVFVNEEPCLQEQLILHAEEMDVVRRRRVSDQSPDPQPPVLHERERF